MSKERRRRITRAKRLVLEAASAVRALNDNDVPDALGTGAMNKLISAIVPQDSLKDYDNLHDFFLAYKYRLSMLAMIRHAITKNHAYTGHIVDGGSCIISPFHAQWFEDGVVFLQSRNEPFSGLFGLYRKDKSLSYAVAARSIAAGEQFGPESLAFISVEEFRDRAQAIAPKDLTDLQRPLSELEQLVETDEREERKYQELIQAAPWLLGLDYSRIDRHTALDDRNIPDFTGVRAKDGKRDIIEIKTPGLAIFKQDGEFHSEFHQTWDQAERYLNFSIQERDYLARKFLSFDNPRCIIIAGRRAPPAWMDKLMAKLRLQPALWVFTYDDLLSYARHTVQFIERLRAGVDTPAG